VRTEQHQFGPTFGHIPGAGFVTSGRHVCDPGHSLPSATSAKAVSPVLEETILSKHDEKLDHRSPAAHQISSSVLDDKDLAKVAGGDKAVKVTHDDYPKEMVTFGMGPSR
jgi:hypothetical protein